MEEKKKGPRFTFKGGHGDPKEIRAWHPRLKQYIYQDELTPKLVSQLKALDKTNGSEFCLCIIENK